MSYVVAWIFLVGMTVFGIALFICGIFWLGNMLMTPAELARIEQLRSDAEHVDPIQAEDVIGQVTQTNQHLITTQTWNESWLFGWLIPDEWDDVELIPVPR